MANTEIRKLAKENHVKLWEIGKRIGISEPTVTRWFRETLSAEREELVRSAIKAIAAEKEQ